MNEDNGQLLASHSLQKSSRLTSITRRQDAPGPLPVTALEVRGFRGEPSTTGCPAEPDEPAAPVTVKAPAQVWRV